MKYTIITAVYNREDCIGRCIESVTRNLYYYNDIEHIIIDDCSTDNTANIVLNYKKKYPHIVFEKLSQNKGTNAARNYAINKAKGEYCIILDSDDYFSDNALDIINNVVSNNSYKEYMFSANDMVDKYSANPLLNKSKYSELNYLDFLSEKVSGDFIHVINTEILRHNPFDEKLRIHEFIFFLKFYQESQKILFTNEIVTIRERSRNDSVTRETIRTNKDVIYRNLQAIIILLDNFKEEYIKYGLTDLLSYYIQQKVENSLLLSRYDLIRDDINNIEIKSIYKIIYKLRIGWVYRLLLSTYLKIKYNILRTKLK